MRAYFREHSELRVASVHSGEGSDPRQTSLERLGAGALDVLFCVDMFNEGLDVPAIDTVLMLRPTESKIIWLQQLGRGLRRAEGKARLVVIDYIGNHRVFLNKPAALLTALGGMVRANREIPKRLRDANYTLPKGCEVTYDLEALEILERLCPPSRRANAIREWYEEFREANERRPTALEAYHCRYNPAALRRDHGSWLGFVAEMGDLSPAEARALAADRAFFDLLETTAMTRSYEIVLLQALLELGRLPGRAPLGDLTRTVARLARRSAALKADISSGVDDLEALGKLLRKHLIAAWAAAKGDDGQPLFALDDDTWGTTATLSAPEPAALADLAAELLDWRLARYLDDQRKRVTFKVIRNASGNPILKIDRQRHELPEGWSPVTIDGQAYRANFVKHYVNVVRPPDSDHNVLPDLMTRWFGDDAGARGTRHTVAHDRSRDGGYTWTPADPATPDTQTQVLADDGTPVDARYAIEERDGAATLVIESRGGNRNDDYNRGLEILLDRLARAHARIERIAVDTGGTRQLSLEQRTLAIAELPFPLELSPQIDATDLRRRIGRAAAAVGRSPGAKGSGNTTKRLRLWVAGVTVAGLAVAVTHRPR